MLQNIKRLSIARVILSEENMSLISYVAFQPTAFFNTILKFRIYTCTPYGFIFDILLGNVMNR